MCLTANHASLVLTPYNTVAYKVMREFKREGQFISMYYGELYEIGRITYADSPVRMSEEFEVLRSRDYLQSWPQELNHGIHAYEFIEQACYVRDSSNSIQGNLVVVAGLLEGVVAKSIHGMLGEWGEPTDLSERELLGHAFTPTHVIHC